MATVKFDRIFKVYSNGYSAIKNLCLDIEDGEFMVFVGPSGCGKSTALRMLAGLEDISAGKLWIGDQVVNQQTPQQRNIAMVFQNYALYPHKSVRQNLEFPLRMMNLSKIQIEGRVQEAAHKLGLDSILDRKPKQLSGGQRQRVAMGRAIVRDPSVFLMDEPLSNLDAKMRTQIRAEISALQRKMAATTVYVIHDQVEAMTMGDRVAVMRSGELQQVGTPQTLYDEPANIFVAGFLGSPAMNIFRSQLSKTESGALILAFGQQFLEIPTATFSRYRQVEQYLNQPILAGLRPEAFSVADMKASGASKNVIQVEIKTLEALGHEMILYVDAPIQRIEIEESQSKVSENSETPSNQSSPLIARIPSFRSLQPLQTVALTVDTSKLYLFTAAGERMQ